ncbi:MAG TPA: GTPase [Gammaproteobacteria bacterium]|nr:GTPase [Gammaproteobacteria bacterium]
MNMIENDKKRILIMGAAGRDFHNFNMVYRDDTQCEVVAFTATQIPQISNRIYPASLSGSLYPQGIPIIDEVQFGEFCRQESVAQVVFAYSDITHQEVMHRASIALAAGADYLLLGPNSTMIKSSVPVIAVSAVRTGSGKSQTCRWMATYLRSLGHSVVVIRHPMPYGDLERQAVQRFQTLSDLHEAQCTIEEREEYELHLKNDVIVYAGVDYQAITEQAQQEADIILWDGGNNDFPFIKPDLHIALLDPLRAGHETIYHPGETVLRMADILVISKVNVASDAQVDAVMHAAKLMNANASILKAGSTVQLSDAGQIRGKRVLVIEDGPTTTHGGMAYGAGYVAALEAEAIEIVDPRQGASDEYQVVFSQYPHLKNVLPALGYFPSQLKALENSINAIEADLVVSATPCDLSHLISINKPMLRVGYEYSDGEPPNLQQALERFLRQQKLID